MAVATFWKGDTLPVLRNIPELKAEKSFNVPLLANIMGINKMEVERRFMEQNDAWILTFQTMPVAFGWVARAFAPVGELERFISVPGRQIYLWNFRTLTAWRGKGFYPLLLQSIIAHELKKDIDRIWILTAPENKASTNGVVKAGFTVVGNLAYDEQNSIVLVPTAEGVRVSAALALLNVPVAPIPTKPCWCCNSPHMRKAKGECQCACNEVQGEGCIC